MGYNIQGLSGRRYYYQQLYSVHAGVPGNYAFVRIERGAFNVLYFGETGDLSERLSGHPRLKEAEAMHMTHILAYPTYADEEARRAEEQDLIALWTPPLNVQHKMNAFGLLMPLRLMETQMPVCENYLAAFSNQSSTSDMAGSRNALIDTRGTSVRSR